MPETPPQSGWQRLWSVLMGREALNKAAAIGDAPRPSAPPQNQDTSVVQKAAREAGERMEAEKASKVPIPNNPRKYGLGGIVQPISKYGKYPRK